MITAKGTKWAGESLTVSDLVRLDLLTIFFPLPFNIDWAPHNNIHSPAINVSRGHTVF
jgi:hypothetical protein